MGVFIWLAVVCLLALPNVARAELWQAPVGGRPIELGGEVACDEPGAGWALEGATKRLLRPPTEAVEIGTSTVLHLAGSAEACASQTREITLVAVGPRPVLEPSSVVLWPDEGRLEARGRRLEGVQIAWLDGDELRSDACRDPRGEGGVERCEWNVGRDRSADPMKAALRVLPAGARAESDALLFDAEGHRLAEPSWALVPARVLLTRLVAVDAALDLASGRGEVPLLHPEAVASAECSGVPCGLSGGRVIAQGSPSLVSQIEVRVRLVPHVFLVRKDGLETQASAKLPVLHCPMAIVSGPVVRDNQDAKLVLKLEGGCARDFAALRYRSDASPLKVVSTVQYEGATFVLLRLGHVADDGVTVTALRGGDADALVLGVAHVTTRPAPNVRASLELPGHPNLGFIPNNAHAVVHISDAGERQRLALLPIEGVYAVGKTEQGLSTVRGDPNAAGLTELRFGVRAEGLPPPLAEADLAVVRDSLQRAVREANVPAPIAAAAATPLAEVVCGPGGRERLLPGETAHLDFALRDTCRIIFHRERLAPELGTQKLNLEVDVIRADGTARGEAHVSEVVTLRSGAQPREVWIRGILDPFDRMVVRLSHVADEVHYVGGAELNTRAAEAQWSAILGTGRMRLYATSTIPTGLYRFGDHAHSGVLSLNFGVLSRLTWLDEEGHEGFIGAEAGVLAFDLASSADSPGTRVGGVIGLGVAVPIANRSSVGQASINLHAWFESDFTGSSDDSSRYAFVFGPSISIGNVGVNL